MIHNPNYLIPARITLTLYSLLLITLCLINPTKVNIANVMIFDKLLHFLAYLGFGFISFFATKSDRQFFFYLWLGFCLGIAIEIAQTLLTESRQADLYDQIANTAGLAFAFLLSLPASAIIQRQVKSQAG